MIRISPSILTADFAHLGDALKRLEDAGVEMIHVDVMDGVFVPNISIGIPVCRSIQAATRLPLDVHLMIIQPQKYIEQFAATAERVTIHYESDCDVRATLRQIRAAGALAALSIKPATPAEAVFDLLDEMDMVLVMSVEPGFGGQSYLHSATEKIAVLRREIDRRGLKVEIEVDGGINEQTAPEAAAAGVDILVAGSALFNAPDMTEAVKALRAAAAR